MGLGGGGDAVIGGLPNLVQAVATSLTSPLGGPIDIANLKTDEPSQTCRIVSLSPARASFTITFSEPQKLSHFAIAGHSLRTGKFWRVVGKNAVGLPDPITVFAAPDAVLDSTNFTGSVTDFDESPESPDGVWVGPTNNAQPWSVRCSLATPSSAPIGGSKMQSFVLWMRRQGAVVEGSGYPVVTVELWDSGSFVESLGSRVITSDTGQRFVFNWDSALLANPDGSGAEFLISVSRPSGATVHGELDAIRWYLIIDHPSGWDLDTGALRVSGYEPSTLWGGSTSEQAGLPNSTIGTVFTEATVQSMQVMFWDDGVKEFVDFVKTPVVDPETFLDFGVFSTGPIFTLPYNFAPGFGLRVASTIIGASESLGGQTFATAVGRRRVAENIQFIIPSAGGSEIFSRIDYAAAGVQPFFVSLAPGDDPRVQRHTNLWVTAADAGGMTWSGWFLPEAGALKDEVVMRYTFLEKL